MALGAGGWFAFFRDTGSSSAQDTKSGPVARQKKDRGPKAAPTTRARTARAKGDRSKKKTVARRKTDRGSKKTVERNKRKGGKRSVKKKKKKSSPAA